MEETNKEMRPSCPDCGRSHGCRGESPETSRMFVSGRCAGCEREHTGEFAPIND